MAYSEDVEEIYMEPPAPNILTDEDSGDEDGGGLTDNLAGSQLRAAAEIILSNNERMGDFSEKEGDFSEKEGNFISTNVIPGEQQEPELSHLPKTTFQPRLVSDWIKGDFENAGRSFVSANFAEYKDLSCVELFEKFFDEDVMNYLTDQITRYALFQNCVDPKVSVEELKCFLGILILSGYNTLPGKRYYWEANEDVRNNLISNSMRRERFLQISRFLHCADNSVPDLSDKVWKMRPLMDRLKARCVEHFQPQEQLCYDESMVKYFGRHSCKQFIRGKPIRFGYKMWCLNTTSGYLVNFEMYQGNSPRRNTNYEKHFGKASAPFVQMLDDLPETKRNLPYKLYFDNLFTGLNLLTYLKEKGYDGTGTIRENRIPRNCSLSDKKNFQKSPRGTYESVIDRNSGVMLVRWLDNNIVTVASTCHGVMPISNVRRYSQAEKQMVSMPRPNMIGQYNACMGGTDLMDENVNRYRIGIRGKKWWWCLFTWLVDVSVHNAWQLHKRGGSNLQQLAFRREIVNSYLRSYGTRPKGAGRPSTSKSSISFNRVSDHLRYDRLDHLIISISDNKRRRCAGEGCSSSVRTMCQKCNVGICVPCFAIFHTQ